MTTKRMFRETKTQGEDEAIAYQIDVSPWGTSPTGVSVTVFDVTDKATKADWTDVTTTVMPTNTPSVVGNMITLSKLRNLTDAHVYRLEVKFTVAELGDCEAYGFVVAGE